LKNQHFLLLMGLFAMFAFTGCPQSETKTPVAKKEEIKNISLQLQWFTQAQFAGYYVALDKGWYKDEDLELTIYPGGPDIVPVDIVTGGSRDFGTTLLADLAVSIQKGKPAVSIAQIQQNNGLRLLAKAGSGIREPKDFTGKTVGVWLGGWEVQFNALLSQAGVQQEKVNVVSQGFSMAPFLEGRIDVASAMIYNEYYMVLSSGIQKEDLVMMDYADYHLDFPGDVLFTSLKMVKENPEVCLKMLRASLKGWKFALENQEEAVNIVLKHDKSGVATRDHQKKMMAEIAGLVSGKGTAKIGHTDPLAFQRMTNLLAQYKILDAAVDPERIYTARFLNEIKE
jgi:NitT/TauT family transport system substrate-binding protein